MIQCGEGERSQLGKGSPSRTRTYNISVNSRTLCQLSYQGLQPKVIIAAVHADVKRIGYKIAKMAAAFFRFVLPSVREPF